MSSPLPDMEGILRHVARCKYRSLMVKMPIIINTSKFGLNRSMLTAQRQRLRMEIWLVLYCNKVIVTHLRLINP
jgi:hypothetical protein